MGATAVAAVSAAGATAAEAVVVVEAAVAAAEAAVVAAEAAVAAEASLEADGAAVEAVAGAEAMVEAAAMVAWAGRWAVGARCCGRCLCRDKAPGRRRERQSVRDGGLRSAEGRALLPRLFCCRFDAFASYKTRAGCAQ